jgi:hypothetical protein
VSNILDQVLGLYGTVVCLIVGDLAFAEDVLFVGFVLPGETAAILGGVAASRHNVVPAENCVRAGRAACSYSWRRPPRRSWWRMRSWASWSRLVIGLGSGASGRALAMP